MEFNNDGHRYRYVFDGTVESRNALLDVLTEQVEDPDVEITLRDAINLAYYAAGYPVTDLPKNYPEFGSGT
jgi:hypothetical protein